MPGFNRDSTGATDQNVMFADNYDFSGSAAPAPQVSASGILPIGTGGTPAIKPGVLTSPDGSIAIGYSTPNITLQVSGGSQYISLSPFIVGTDVHSSYTTIQAAINAAVAAGASISNPLNVYVKPKNGSAYVENLTLQPGVNLVGFGQVPAIFGKMTYTQAGTVNISNFYLQTNSDNILSVSGGAASYVVVNNCYLSVGASVTGIAFTSSSVNATIIVNNCYGNIGASGALWAMTSPGNLYINYCQILNGGLSTTQSTNSAGQVRSFYNYFEFPIATSGTAIFGNHYTFISAGATNSTALTLNGSGQSNQHKCIYNSGNSPCISIGAAGNTYITFCDCNSSNTNVITGAGSMRYAFISFSGTSSGTNVTTTTPIPTLI
ncbi:MAG: hypothetical protein JSR39_10945 [Verrucomicrobia bacterium]|nr:hypothetical protein [Verrucomicrobiota bacterium]